MNFFCYFKEEYRLALIFLFLTNGAAFILSGVIDDFYVYNILAFISLTVLRISFLFNYRSSYAYMFFSASYLTYALDDILLNSTVLSGAYYPLYYCLTAYLVWSVSNVFRIRSRVISCSRNFIRAAFRSRNIAK